MTISSDRPEPTFNHQIAPDTEALGIEIWQRMFPRIDDIRSKLTGTYVQVVEERSSLRLDDRYLGQWREGGLHRTAINAAWDALKMVQTVLEPVITGDSELPMSALYPVLRAAIESSALAIYLLEPTSRDERLRRAYWIGENDARYLGTFSATTRGVPSPVRAQVREHIRELLDSRPSIEEAAPFSFKDIAYSDLVTLADAAVSADPALPNVERTALLAWWQLLSGLSHGKAWAFLAGLERSGAVIDRANESAGVMMTSSATEIALILQRAVEALETALRLYGQRSKAAWAQPEDASEPPVISYSELQGRSSGGSE